MAWIDALDFPDAAAPTVAVVVPALNEAARLPRLLAALARTAPEDDRAQRVIVADGGSADDTVALARAAGADVVHAAPGRGTQLAAGARAASEDVLVFLHADTVPAPGSLAAVRRALADPRVAAAGMRQRIEAAGLFYRLVERAADARVRRLGVVYGDSGLATRRATYEAAGGFAELPLFEDVDLSRRLRRRGRIVLADGAELWVSPRRWQREGALRRTLRNWHLTLRYAAGADPARLARAYATENDARGST